MLKGVQGPNCLTRRETCIHSIGGCVDLQCSSWGIRKGLPRLHVGEIIKWRFWGESLCTDIECNRQFLRVLGMGWKCDSTLNAEIALMSAQGFPDKSGIFVPPTAWWNWRQNVGIMNGMNVKWRALLSGEKQAVQQRRRICFICCVSRPNYRREMYKIDEVICEARPKASCMNAMWEVTELLLRDISGSNSRQTWHLCWK